MILLFMNDFVTMNNTQKEFFRGYLNNRVFDPSKVRDKLKSNCFKSFIHYVPSMHIFWEDFTNKVRADINFATELKHFLMEKYVFLHKTLYYEYIDIMRSNVIHVLSNIRAVLSQLFPEELLLSIQFMNC